MHPKVDPFGNPIFDGPPVIIGGVPIPANVDGPGSGKAGRQVLKQQQADRVAQSGDPSITAQPDPPTRSTMADVRGGSMASAVVREREQSGMSALRTLGGLVGPYVRDMITAGL